MNASPVFRLIAFGWLLLWLVPVDAQRLTYCNPMDLDYGYTPIPNFSEQGRHRATADPVITVFDNAYFLFSTNQWGYWWSENLVDWTFVPRLFLKPWHNVYDELCAPGTLVLGDTLLVIGSTHTKTFPLWMSQAPRTDSWTEAVDSFQVGAWDPAFFADDDGKVYVYWGSSNFYPLYGQEIDRKTFEPKGERVELFHLQDSLHGWERFGEHADNTFLKPFMEGAWMNKYQGKYYLQYAAPGTEFSGYGDGVYTGDNPLGPFTYQAHNPFAYKPGGFARGTGHGATFEDLHGQWWHIGTQVIAVRNNFERRLGLWPVAFDADGLLTCNTAYGDYPHFLSGPGQPASFTGWMLLNYQKPVTVSSTLGGYYANFAVDEDIKTYWSAASGGSGEWIQTDLGEVSELRAVQINFADQGVDFLGKQSGIYHQFVVTASEDGRKWKVIWDAGTAREDRPHAYLELPRPVQARFVRVENRHMPGGTFAISGLRVFGKQAKPVPAPVKQFVVLRGDSERRNAWLKWQLMDDAQGYVIYTGIAPDKLYTSVMVYGKNEYYFTAMDRDRPYYFQIEAFNEAGAGARSEVMKVE